MSVMNSWHRFSYRWLLSWWGGGTRMAVFCSLCVRTGRGRVGCVQPGKLTWEEQNSLLSHFFWMTGLLQCWAFSDSSTVCTLLIVGSSDTCGLQLPCLWMGGHTLEQCEGITYSVGLVCCQGGGVDWWIDVDDFLSMTRIKYELPIKPVNLG